jgi:Sel1 repeat
MHVLSLRRLAPMIAGFITFFFVCSHNLAAQQKPGTTPLGSPLEMRLCVDNGCETLTWRGDHYAGVKDKASDISTHYTVEQWSPAGIRLRGKSVAAVSVNRQAIGPIPIATHTYIEGVFTGVIAPNGNSIEDAVVKWQVGKQSGEKIYKLTWNAEASASASSIACSEASSSLPRPSLLEVCDGPCILQQDGNLGAWTFHGNEGTGSWLKGSRANLRIARWDEGKMTIVREDTPNSTTPGATVTYQGVVCGATIKGEALVNWPGHVDNVQVPWTATIPITTCDALEDDSLKILDVAHEALRFRQLPSAFKCLSRAADLGDMQARTATGLMYRDGIGTKVSFPDAMTRFLQSAIQGDYNAEVALSQMYDFGLGVTKDPVQAKDWATRAYNNPVKIAERQNARQQADSQKLAFLGLSALVEAMSQPEVYIVR